MNNRVHQGHLARKRFGQNFLNDQFVIDSIVSDRDRNTIRRCMETTGKVYEKGILALMREGTS